MQPVLIRPATIEARSVLVTFEHHFLRMNLKVVRVGLLYSNKPAARFYHKAGYQPYEIVYEKRLKE